MVERVITRLVRYPLLTAQVVFFVIVAWGIVGGELGASDSFWHEWWFSQFSVGIATCWLFGTVVFVSTLLLAPHGLPGLATDSRPSFRYGWWPTLFPSRNPGVRLVGARLLGWLVLLFVVVYVGKWAAIHIGAYSQKTPQQSYEKLLREAKEVFDKQHDGQYFALGYGTGLLLGAAFSYVVHRTGLRERFADREWLRRSFADPTVAIPTSPVEVPTALGGGVLTTMPGSEVPPLYNDDKAPADASDALKAAMYNLRTLLLLHATAAVFAFAIIALLLLVYSNPRLLSPGVLLSLFLISLNVGGGVVAFRWPYLRVTGVAILLVLVGMNLKEIQPYRMTYDNIAGEQVNKNGERRAISYDDPVTFDDNTYHEVYRGQVPAGGLIDGDQLLKDFAAKYPGGQKPRLVVVAVSGGGIRAAVWTSVVLEGLEQEFDGSGEGKKQKPIIRNHIRVIAGASGGMVGAGAYVARFEDGPLIVARDKHHEYNGLLPFSQLLARDSLAPVAQTMIVRDFTTSALLPFPTRLKTDRGHTLEDAWSANFTDPARDDEKGEQFLLPKTQPFARKIRELRALEATCDRPSLIFAPMMVEDSKRLLVSNLDLDTLTYPKAHRIDATDNPTGLALPAVEFFRVFNQSDAFTVSSAARMNASFPVVSPAVALPVKPTRRVVDGGYFDNYGIDIIADWLLHHQQAVAQHTSGVLLIQIRAYPLEQSGGQFLDESPSPALAVVAAVSAPLQAVLTARSMAAYQRNNELIAELHRVFNAPDGKDQKKPDSNAPPFFATVVFEQQQEAALSWYLTSPQKKQVAEGFYKKSNNSWEPHDGKDGGNYDPNRDIKKKLEAIGAWLTASHPPKAKP